MKQLITITIDAPSHNDMTQCSHVLMRAVNGARKQVNGGAKVKVATTDAGDPSAMMRVMGQLKWWSLGRVKEEKKKGFWAKLGEELNSVLEVE